MDTVPPVKTAYVIAWLILLAFLGWSGNLLMDIQSNWMQTNALHRQQKDLGALTQALQNLNRPGNDVLEHYQVEQNHAAFRRYSQEFRSALAPVMEWTRGDPALAPAIDDLRREQASLSGFAREILELAAQREALRTGGAAEDAVREKENLAAATMARMDQAFQNGLQRLLTAKERVVEREQDMESQQRAHFKALYFMLFVALLASALSVELTRRSMRQRKALRDSSARINAIMNNVVDGIITVDDQGRIESSNPAADAMFGYRTSSLAGLRFTDLLGATCRCNYLEQAGGGNGTTVAPFTLIDCEQPGQRRDGSCFPMELAVSHVTVNGRHLRIHIVRDITARRRAESGLRQAAGVFEHINEGIMVTDAQGILQSVNPAFTAITQYEKEEVLGRNPNLLQSGRHDREFYRDMWAAITNRGQWQGEIWNRRKNGEIYPQWLTINAIRDERGQTTNYLGVTWDITELKKSERMKQEFITTVSHELRTPLTSVLGSLELLIRGDGGPIPEQANRLLRMAYSNSGRLVRLVGDILDFEKMSSGRMKFRLETQDLMPLVRQTMSSNSTLSRQSGIDIALVESLPHARVNCDAERLMQALTNLLANAIKFSPPGDVVEVAVSRRPSTIRIAVTDHGPGIPDEFRPQVFEKFTQRDDANLQQKGGLGLGLSIAKLIVRQHNGSIDYESEPGVRTTFFIELPESARDTDG
jgi:PAS domain S-box-containing protein